MMAVLLEVIQLISYLFYTYIDALISLFVTKKPRSVTGKVVLVTGAGHGIGREIALQFSQRGAKLVLLDINQTNNEKVASEIRERSGSVVAYTCDVSNVDDVKDVCAKVHREVGEVDILVNNAGIINAGALLELSDKDIKRNMDINIMAQFWMLRELLPAMIQKNSGYVINMASMGGLFGSAYATDYCASKFAIVGMTQALANEMRREGHTGINITYVCPMFVDTGILKYWYDRFGRLLTPQEVAKATIDGALTGEAMVTIPSHKKLQLRIQAKPRSVAGKLVLVTGAGHGIGREIALQFSHRGAKLVLLDINQINNEKVADEIREHGVTANAYTCDVSNVDDVKDVCAKVRREVGNPDILVNNAGIINGGALLDLSDKDIRRTMDINIMAHFWTVRELLPAMIERNSGYIINISSVSGLSETAYATDYCASKFAIVGLTEALADEMRREGHTGIKFTVVCPAAVGTGMLKYWYSRFGGLLTPHEVAKATIDGALSGERLVTIPAYRKWHLRIKALTPRKFVLRLNKFMGVGFHPQYEKSD